MESPCFICEHHLAKESKDCARCGKCEKRVAYIKFLDPIGFNTPIKRVKKKKKVIPKKKPGPAPIKDWTAIKRVYKKKVVPRKMTMKALGILFDVSFETLRRKRSQGKWPPIAFKNHKLKTKDMRKGR